VTILPPVDPPLEAWRALSLTRPVLERAEPVQRRKRKAEVWRLSGRPAGERVFAKRCRLTEAATEKLVYSSILPRIGMESAQYLGCVDARDDRTAWLFVREVQGAGYTADEPLHRELAAAWLAALHASARDAAEAQELPDVGPRRYRAMLEGLVRTLPAAAGNEELGRAEVEVLDDATSCCQGLLALWPAVESAVAPLPHTLVHGSFSRRNMLVASTTTGPVLSVFDWAAAGWGIPARDLVKLASPTIAGTAATYWRILPDVGASDRDLLIALGRLFRAVEHMSWLAPRLSYPGVEQPMRKAAAHFAELVAGCDVLRRLV
jgi:Phosphotransferase enzyme family